MAQPAVTQPASPAGSAPRSLRSAAGRSPPQTTVAQPASPLSPIASSRSRAPSLKMSPSVLASPSPSLPNPTPFRPRTAERKRRPTFVSCTAYPETGPTAVTSTMDDAELQRSMRRSKVQALNKIDRAGTPGTPAPSSSGLAATSFVPPATEPLGPSVSRNPLRRMRPAAPPFDLRTVRTSAPRHVPSRKDRAFGLEECPTYYPTAEQFTDPMAYIESIAPEAKRYGICKITPPDGWQMPFRLETDQFRFKTRLQRLNSLEAASRAKINFLEQLSMYHHQQGDQTVTIPIIERRMLDLWRLRKEVNKLGGVDEVNRLKAWEAVTEKLEFDPVRHAAIIRTAYMRIVSPFENFVLRAKAAPAGGSPTSQAANGSNGHAAPPVTPSRPAGRMGTVRTSPRSRMSGFTALQAQAVTTPNGSLNDLAQAAKIKVPGFSRSEGSDSELSDEDTSPIANRRHPNGKYEKGEICRAGHAANKILLCDGCDRGFHTYCLDPPLSAVPTNEEWFCTACLLGTGDDYGFDEGEEHSLASFQMRDAAFSHAWFNRFTPTLAPLSSTTRSIGSASVSEADVEREFWRLVESQDETVETEYGADVHSTTHGSAAPTMETHPLDPYSRSGWNLNNMPIVRDSYVTTRQASSDPSVLRYIKSDISGMTVPWIYVGMLFSAFCWHNEDHYTYSVNYMFWGETKTWYGVPGDHAERFEAAMKREAPELFEAQPQLLYQLVTMMNPGRMRDEGVDVFACDQRPNEFVITFPKAYHCGFNHGINFNEAVNFALPDWLKEGEESVARYKEHAKAPVFSHDELLITITLYSDTIKTALWLQDSLRQMVEQECARRDKLRAAVPDIKETLIEEDVSEDQYQCCVCKSFCYLSQVICQCTKLVTCLDHADQLCSCLSSARVMRKRFSENQLEEILDVVTSRAALPQQWLDRLDEVCSVARPQLKSLRALVADGERIPYALPGLDDLRVFVDRANAWCDRVATFAVRKSAARRRKSGKGVVEDDEADRSAEALEQLLRESDRLAFDAPEILQLRQLVSSIASFRVQAATVLAADEPSLDDCQTTLILGESLNVDLAEIPLLSAIVNRLRWYHRVEEEVDDRTLQYDDICDLLAEAQSNNVPDDYPAVVELRKREQRGREWLESADALLDANVVELDKIEALITGQDFTPTSLDKFRKLETVLKTATGWQASASGMLANHCTVTAATRLCKAVRGATGPLGRVYVAEIELLQRELDYTANWQSKLANLLGVAQNKLATTLVELVKDFEIHFDEDDLEPNDDHVCFCRQAPTASMTTCTVCQGMFHFKCVGLTSKQAADFTCQVCVRLQYNDRPSMLDVAAFGDVSRWQFVVVPPEADLVDRLCALAVEHARHVLPLIDPKDDAAAQPDAERLMHALRKTWTLVIQLDVVNTATNERVVIEDWLYRRLHEALQAASGTTAGPRKRARRARFELPGAKEKTFSCFCTTPPLDHLLTVDCSKCGQGFHMSCAKAPLIVTGDDGRNWRCPYCNVREGKVGQKGVDLRVQMLDKLGSNEFVDYRSTLRMLTDTSITVTMQPDPSALVIACSGFTPPFIPEGYVMPTPKDKDVDANTRRKRRKGSPDAAKPNGHGVALMQEGVDDKPAIHGANGVNGFHDVPGLDHVSIDRKVFTERPAEVVNNAIRQSSAVAVAPGPPSQPWQNGHSRISGTGLPQYLSSSVVSTILPLEQHAVHGSNGIDGHPANIAPPQTAFDHVSTPTAVSKAAIEAMPPTPPTTAVFEPSVSEARMATLTGHL